MRCSLAEERCSVCDLDPTHIACAAAAFLNPTKPALKALQLVHPSNGSCIGPSPGWLRQMQDDWVMRWCCSSD